MSVPTVKLDAVQVLALACFGVAVGVFIKRRLRFLDALNIPAPIVGGLLYALIALGLRDRVVNFEMDEVLRGILQVAFFTTIGMTASLKLLRKGGAQVALFLLLAVVGAVLQNVLGIGLARALGLSPLIGIVSGSVALTGGPSTAFAFGGYFEALGVKGATTVGVASAMFGITAGGLLGGFIGGRLLQRHGLRSTSRGVQPALVQEAEVSGEIIRPSQADSSAEDSPLFNTLVAIAVAMGLGTLISAGVERAGITLPNYVGAMLVASLLRNVDDATGWFGLSERHVEAVGNVSLYVFISMAMLTLKLWELAHLALPILGLLSVQVVLVCLLCLLVFRVMGRDYEAAVMSGGYCGFMLGTTANALACMGQLTGKHGPAPRAYIVVPLVGAFLIDFTNALLITGMVNGLKWLGQ